MEQHGQRDGQCGRVHHGLEMEIVGQTVDGHDGEDHRGQPPRSEPSDEGQGAEVESGADQRQGDRDHPDDSEAEHGIQHRLPGHSAAQYRTKKKCTEQHPYGE